MLVAVVLGVALAGAFGWVDHNLARRGVGAALALLLLVLGNQFPRLVLPRAARQENPAPVLAAERFAATILVCAGLAALPVWVWWPAAQVMQVTGVIILAGFGLAAANWARVLLTGAAAAGAVCAGLMSSPARLSLLMLMHALLWVAVMFLADSIWGDVVSRWLLVPFTLLNGWLALLFARRRKQTA
ncbi:hypothetical protein [Maricaulis sp.]|uniref:hypothetical protein n=1 Tax=Maricaulis sp. TaxID=1486257 RepID=UPI003A92D8F2